MVRIPSSTHFTLKGHERVHVNARGVTSSFVPGKIVWKIREIENSMVENMIWVAEHAGMADLNAGESTTVRCRVSHGIVEIDRRSETFSHNRIFASNATNNILLKLPTITS